MRGTLTIIKADGTITEETLTTAPDIDKLQAAVGGWIETVPYFSKYRGTNCVAFCNEEGKLEGLPPNHAATELWYAIVPRARGLDYLVGSIAIISGDDALLRQL